MKKSATILLTALLLGPVACESRTNEPGGTGTGGTGGTGERPAGQPTQPTQRPGARPGEQQQPTRPGETTTRPGGQQQPGAGGQTQPPAGGAAGGAMGAAESEADRTMSASVRRALTEDPNLSSVAQSVQATASNGVVTLRGTVSSQEQKDSIEQKARSIPGVTRVNNELEVRGG